MPVISHFPEHQDIVRFLFSSHWPLLPSVTGDVDSNSSLAALKGLGVEKSSTSEDQIEAIHYDLQDTNEIVAEDLPYRHYFNFEKASLDLGEVRDFDTHDTSKNGRESAGKSKAEPKRRHNKRTAEETKYKTDMQRFREKVRQGLLEGTIFYVGRKMTSHGQFIEITGQGHMDMLQCCAEAYCGDSETGRGKVNWILYKVFKHTPEPADKEDHLELIPRENKRTGKTEMKEKDLTMKSFKAQLDRALFVPSSYTFNTSTSKKSRTEINTEVPDDYKKKILNPPEKFRDPVWMVPETWIQDLVSKHAVRVLEAPVFVDSIPVAVPVFAENIPVAVPVPPVPAIVIMQNKLDNEAFVQTDKVSLQERMRELFLRYKTVSQRPMSGEWECEKRQRTAYADSVAPQWDRVQVAWP